MSSLSPQNDIDQSIFLRLPLEIRRMIYILLLPKRQLDITKLALKKRGSRVTRLFVPTTGILRTCKKISDEALDVLYGQNKFMVRIEAGSLPELSAEFGVANLSRIRHLNMFAYPRHSDTSRIQPCRRGWKIDSHVWQCLLGNLQQLKFYLKQPLMFATAAGILGLKKDMHEWIAFLELFLPFLARSIDKETEFSILHGGSALTAKHVAKYFRPQPKNLYVQTMINWNINEKANFRYESRLLDNSG